MTALWRPHRAALLHAIIRLELWRRLAGLHTRGSIAVDSSAVHVIVANHTGRYDGFAIWRERFHRQSSGRMFTLMLGSQVKKHPIFKGAGAIGIFPDRPETLRHVARFMESELRPGDTLLMFPQGRILPGDTLPLRFGQLPRLASWCPHRLKLTAVGLATEMLHQSKPSVFMDIDEPVDVQTGDNLVTLSEERVSLRVKNIRRVLQDLGEDAVHQFKSG